MIIKLDGRNISDIKVLNEYIVLNHSNFEIELIQNSDEWLQISCEDFYISIARKENKLINYYSDIKQKELYEIINSYYHNPHGFVITQKNKTQKKEDSPQKNH